MDRRDDRAIPGSRRARPASAQACHLYEANAHIFEDELDALAALGITPSPFQPLAAA